MQFPDVQRYIISKNTVFSDVFLRFSVSNRYNQLLVVDEACVLVGIIGMNEMKTALNSVNASEKSAIDIANTKFTSVVHNPDYQTKCFELFYWNSFNSIPIVTDEAKPVGIIHRFDFPRFQMISFSECHEDVVLNYVLLDQKEVFYIDVGAFDPWLWSVTKWFSLNRGRGINIEPQDRYFNSLMRDRPNDVNICAAVSDSIGEVLFFTCCGIGTEGLSTAVREYANESSTQTAVPMTTLEYICNSHLQSGQEIHFLKIDVEGFEKQVLQGSDLMKFRPWIILIESTKPCTSIPVHTEWEHVLLENDYVFTRQYGINRFYIANEKAHLHDRFLDLDTLFRRLHVIDAYPPKF